MPTTSSIIALLSSSSSSEKDRRDVSGILRLVSTVPPSFIYRCQSLLSAFLRSGIYLAGTRPHLRSVGRVHTSHQLSHSTHYQPVASCLQQLFPYLYSCTPLPHPPFSQVSPSFQFLCILMFPQVPGNTSDLSHASTNTPPPPHNIYVSSLPTNSSSQNPVRVHGLPVCSPPHQHRPLTLYSCVGLGVPSATISGPRHVLRSP